MGSVGPAGRLIGPPSLDAEGFIHCSTIAHQAIETANLYYRGQHDLLVLRIDERKLLQIR